MRTIGNYNLSEEQNILVELSLYGFDLIGEAGSGTGKTSTLCAIEKYKAEKGERGYYICFNKSLSDEAKNKFSSNLTIGTAHSFAYKAICMKNKNQWNKKLNGRLDNDSIIKYSEIDIASMPLKSKWSIGSAILLAVNNYCDSASEVLAGIHVCEKIMSFYDKEEKTNPNICKKLAYVNYIIKHANILAAKYLDENSDCPSSCSAYFKKWQLSKPIFDCDYLLFDEAQDANPAVLAVILNQPCQKILVGDNHQSIYSFTNAINAMSFVPFINCTISQSFRYAQSLADLANKLLDQSSNSHKIKLTGKGKSTEIIRASNYNELDERVMLISRTNSTLFECLITLSTHNVPTNISIPDLNKQIENIKLLLAFNQGENVTLPYGLRHIKSWDDLIKNQDADSDIIRLAKIIDNNPQQALALIPAIKLCQKTEPNDAKVILTTAHKSKGLEADSVYICDDFESVISSYLDSEDLAQEELNLLYVAITRAKKKLILSDLMYDLLISNKRLNVIATHFEPFTIDQLPEISGRALINRPQPTDEVLETIINNAKKPYLSITDDNLSEASEQLEIALEVDTERTITQNNTLPSTISNFDELVKNNWCLPYGTSAIDKKLLSKEIANKMNQNPDSEYFKKIMINTFPTQNYMSIELGCVGIEENINKVESERKKDEIRVPQFWTPLDSSRFENPNLAIVGTMGTGKTQLVKSILYSMHKQRHLNCGQDFGLLILDYKEDYSDQQFVEKTGAIVLTPNKLPINPFAIFDKTNNMATLKTADAFINTLVRTYRIGTKQQRCIRTIILQCYESFGLKKNNIASLHNVPPTIYDVYQLYCMQEKVPDDLVIAALDILVNYEIFTDDPTAPPLFDLLRNNIVVINLKGFDDIVKTFIVSLLLDSFYLQMHIAGKPEIDINKQRPLTNLILVDEADNIMSHELDALKKILKEGREYGVGCILSTQGLDHFKAGDTNYADYFISWICHKLGSPSTKALEQIFNMTDREAIRSLTGRMNSQNKHQSIFVDAKKNIVFQESNAVWKMYAQDEKQSAQ